MAKGFSSLFGSGLTVGYLVKNWPLIPLVFLLVFLTITLRYDVRNNKLAIKGNEFTLKCHKSELIDEQNKLQFLCTNSQIDSLLMLHHSTLKKPLSPPARVMDR